MAYVKKYATEEERRRAKSAAGKKGAAARIAAGHNRGGRPKGSTNKNPSVALPTKTMTVREPDYKVYVKCASHNGVPIVEFMHLLAESLKKKNPNIFAPDAQKVEM